LPFTVVSNPGASLIPQVVPTATIVIRAQQDGNSNAALALAYTGPIISIDQRALVYRQRQAAAGLEFSFDTGVLTLTLRQDLLISNTLSVCAQQKWIAHERGHVTDNQQVMAHMDASILADRQLQAIFLRQQWHPRSAFQATEKIIFNAISAIFRRLTTQATAHRDTRTEYMRVHRDVLKNCLEPYMYEVNRGDTLSGIAEFFYGQPTWQSIHRANQRVIGSNPNMIRPGQQLLIPRTP
jgi:nucleoid-associated protein YgaU